MPTSRCSARTAAGEPCKLTPRGENSLCLWHDPDLAQTAREARRAGGQRRKREVTVFTAYEVDGLGSIAEIRRVVEFAVSELLSIGQQRPAGKSPAEHGAGGYELTGEG